MKYTQLDQTEVVFKLIKDKLNKFKFNVAQKLKKIDSSKSKKKIIDMKNLLWVQRPRYTVENVQNIEECRLKYQNSLQLLTENCRKTNREIV